MKWIYLLLLFGWLSSQTALALDLKSIQEHYRGIKEISAEIDQTKTSPLLLRPLQSKVKLSFKDEILSWEVSGQEPWRIRFAADGKTEFLNASKALAEIPADAKAKLDRTLALVRKILIMDPALEKDFVQTLKGETLLIKPKGQENSVFFESIEILFQKNADIRRILLKTADDETTLNFHTLHLKRS